jgi:hypothetical protein
MVFPACGAPYELHWDLNACFIPSSEMQSVERTKAVLHRTRNAGPVIVVARSRDDDMEPQLSNRQEEIRPKCLDVAMWRAATPNEITEFIKKSSKRAEHEEKQRKSVLAVRHHLAPIDMYCYLKGRFGEPNGIQNLLRRNSSDNLFHWDFILKAGDEDVYIAGMSREIQIALSAAMTDGYWRDLILAIKDDYKRVGKKKSAVFKSLEKWVIFPNRYVGIAELCADLHATIRDNLGGFKIYRPPSSKLGEQRAVLEELDKRAKAVYRSCLQLSILTPVLAEAFINLVIVMLCKPDIRDDKRQFDAFIRSQIHTRLFDLFPKCNGFARAVDQSSESYKKFKRVMDKRNDTIHGNHSPEREQIETVYFEGTRPLFIEPGDQIGKHFEALERQFEPDAVVKDYEDVWEFLTYLTSCLKPDLVASFTRIIEDPYPGYDIKRKKLGALFPGHYVSTSLEGVRFDDELQVSWSR